MKKIILTSVLILTARLAAQAQVVLTGRITDAATDEPLIGAQVVVTSAKGNGAATDLDGGFRLETKESLPLTLSVEYIGYRTEEIDVYDDSEPVDIQLTEEVNTLSEVVIIGYGTQKRTQLTGSVTTVSADILENSRQATIDAALSGQVSGLNVTASSGQPGAESHIRIRGGNSVNASNEPLYVVDGFIYFKDAATGSTGLGAIEGSLNPLATINPNDIESIEVLKDVSATAIYGSRGANGVILITTKKGSLGQEKSEINYGFSIGVSRISKKLELFDASEWAKLQKDYFGNKGGYTDAQIAALGQGTDWQDTVLRDAVQQTHELSINGGTQKNRYAFSFNYTDQEGIILNSGFTRYNFHTNSEWELKKGLNFGLNVTFGRSKQSGLTTTEGQVFNSSPFSAGITNSFVYALLMPPVEPVYNDDGSYNFGNTYEYSYFSIGDRSANPVYDLKESVADNINNYLLSNVWASYRLGGLTLKASVGLNSEKLTQEYFSGSYTSLGLATQGIGGTGNRQTDVWQQEYTAAYAIDINDNHSLDALAGYTRQTQTSTYSSIRTNHFTNESLKQYNLGDGANIYTPNTGKSESALNSFLARVNYSYLDRYNATATFRADNSSRFARNHRWGYFPSLGLSWNAEKEHFLSGAYDLDYLKVRASAGLVGNQEISDYAFTTSYATGSYGGSSSYSKSNTANDKLKWETTASYNVGVDLGLWHNKVNIVTDVYYKKTSDLLLVVPLGFSAGVSTQLQNVGNVVNKGAELSVNMNLINRKRKSWSVSANIAYNHNEITDMGTTDNVIQGSDNQQILRRGEALGSFYGLIFDGIVQSDEDVTKLPTVNGLAPKAGDIKYVDTDRNGRIDGNDRQILGSTQPALIFGFSTQYTWRNFDLSASFAGSYGNRLYNALGRTLELTTDSYNVLWTVRNSWTPEKGGNTLPLASKARNISYIDDRYVQDASYLKLNNVTVGYRIPFSKEFPARVRIYATGQNLLTLTSYKGYDPEVSSGTDNGAYPSARTILLGTNISF